MFIKNKIVISIFFIIIFLLQSCSDFWNNPDNKPSNSTFSVDRIRWGSKGDPLNGLTIMWRDTVSNNNQIRWGYTEEFEQDTATVIGEKLLIGYSTDLEFDGYIFEYTFPSLNPNSTLYYSLFDGNSWSASELYSRQLEILWKQISGF